MTAAVVRAALALSLLSACSHEFVVLQSAPDTDKAQPRDDAGLDASTLPDAARAEDGATPDAAVVPPDEPRANVVSGFMHTCAIVAGTLYCWGENDFGQVGMPGDDALAPRKLSDDIFTDICAGEQHSCALRRDGTTLCWGDNSAAQLGLGDLNPRATPTELDAPRFEALACGGMNTCALERGGKLWCWGDNAEGKLGQDDPPPFNPGTIALGRMPYPVRPDLRFKEVSVGQGHVCALSVENQLYCWGRNNAGQLGVDTAFSQTRAPLPVVGGTKFTAIAAGQFHSCAVDVEHKLWCWGETAGGRLGLITDQPALPVPTRVDGDDFASVSASRLHSCALKQDGTLYCWGRGVEGQLGVKDYDEHDLPTEVGRDGRWRSVATGNFHSCAFSETELFCWGANDKGQLGQGDDGRRNFPLKVPF